MKIAIGNSRREKLWKNQDISWEEFCNRVKQTIYTAESVDEYKRLPKIEQDNIKDVGGFVGGYLKEGRRKNGNVLSRCIITLDMDYGKENVIKEIKKKCDFKWCIYSTHKHTKENPRLRLIIPLKNEVSEDEYPPLSRIIAKEIDLDLFDDSTYEASRLMYWPSTSRDGEFVYEENDGNFIDANYFLGKYENWRDTTTWPVSSRQSQIFTKELKNQADPLTKEGVVGAFCRTYSMEEAIDKFLTHVYSPSAVNGRYDFSSADSAAGVVIYDNKFAYSHHSTDPASGKLLNAFDMVRIHKFGNLDEDMSPDIPMNRRLSYIAMNEFVINDDLVKSNLVKERMKKLNKEFSVENANDSDWQNLLELDKRGNIKDTLDNMVLILDNDENLKSIVFNSHRNNIDVRGKLPWEQVKKGWNDSDIASLKVYISKIYGIYSPTKTKDGITAVAAKRSYHPIKEYLEGLPQWDGQSRVDNLLIDYFGAENSPYTKSVIKKTMVAAVARIYNPGTKFDHVLILNGPQGIGKSTFFYKLAGQWFSDSLTITDMKDKSGAEKLQGYWILELGELAGMRKTEVETVKSFISREDDKYRVSYGVCVENHPRQCIIVGSTNAENGFLRDITGNRRFWPVRIRGNSKKKAWNISKEEVNQIWAESLMLYKNGEKLYLENEEESMAIREQINAMENDDREGIVRTYLDTLLPETWEKMTLFERRNFLRGNEFAGSKLEGSVKRNTVCNMEIWCECFGNEASMLKAIDSYGITTIMKKIENWDKLRKNKTGSIILPIYGNQRCYERITE